MKTFITLAGAALLLSSTSTLAQVADTVSDAGLPSAGADAGAPSAEGIDEPSAPEAAVSHEGAAHTEGAAADTSASASFTDTQIDGYVTAAIEVQEMEADTALDDAAKQARAGEILAGAGLDPSTFNAISDAVRSDPAVAERVQLALANRRGSPQG